AINEPGGFEAVQLRVAQQYIPEFGKLAKESNTLVLPLNASDVASMVALASNVVKKFSSNGSEATPATVVPPAPARRRSVAEPRWGVRTSCRTSLREL